MMYMFQMQTHCPKLRINNRAEGNLQEYLERSIILMFLWIYNRVTFCDKLTANKLSDYMIDRLKNKIEQRGKRQ